MVSPPLSLFVPWFFPSLPSQTALLGDRDGSTQVMFLKENL